MKQTDPQYKLRIPQDLKERIEAASKESGRSMNAEIVARLQSTFEAQAALFDAANDINQLSDVVRGYEIMVKGLIAQTLRSGSEEEVQRALADILVDVAISDAVHRDEADPPSAAEEAVSRALNDPDLEAQLRRQISSERAKRAADLASSESAPQAKPPTVGAKHKAPPKS